VRSHDALLSALAKHSSASDDCSDEPVDRGRGRNRTKFKKRGTKKRKRSVSMESGVYCFSVVIVYIKTSVVSVVKLVM